MPLIICTVFLMMLLLFEGAWYLTGLAQKEQETLRYTRVEHPRRRTSDSYLDVLG